MTKTRDRRRALLLAWSLASAALIAAPQVRDDTNVVTTGTAQISGTVLSADASPAPAPARRATMTLTGDRSGLHLVAVSDDNGQFAFRSLPADRYTISAAKGGYLPWRYGSTRPGGSGTPVVVADGQRVAIAMTLIRGAVLTGTVRDEQGAPLPEVTISALRLAVSPATGERGLQAVTIGSSNAFANYAAEAFPGTAVTDDRGVYRIYGLAPGEYVVSASVRPPMGSPTVSTDIHQVSRADVQRAEQLLRGSGSGTAVSVPQSTEPSHSSRVNYAPVYHPAALAAAEATIVTLGRSEERAGVDIQVRLVPTATITGIAAQPDGTPVIGAQITVFETLPSASGYSGRGLRITRSSADGTFAFAGINPGRYLVRGGSYPDGLSGVAEVEVAGRDVSTSIVFEPGAVVSGRLVFDGIKPPPAAAVLLIVSPLPFGGMGREIAPDGRFTFSRIPPGKYRLRINGRPPTGWMLQSAMLNGSDVSDIAFEVRHGERIEGAVVTLTDRGGEISGRLVDAAGKPAPEYVLVVYSADRRFWLPGTRRTQHVRPDISGTFVARDLPAGDYLISAVTDLEDGQWNDPTFLAVLAANAPLKITLAEGEKKIQDIRVGGR